jgi:hypothetical protein
MSRKPTREVSVLMALPATQPKATSARIRDHNPNRRGSRRKDGSTRERARSRSGWLMGTSAKQTKRPTFSAKQSWIPPSVGARGSTKTSSNIVWFVA